MEKTTQKEVSSLQPAKPISPAASPSKTKKKPNMCFEVKEGKLSANLNDSKEPNNAFLQTLCEAAGTANGNSESAFEVIAKAAKCIQGCSSEAEQYNIVLQELTQYQPTDTQEARLCAQAVSLYSQGMKYLERATNVLSDEGTFCKDHWNQIYMKNAVRLLDLHAKTIESLVKYRSRGEQVITVVHQNVNVEDGGKAIVGNIVPRTIEASHE